MSGRAQGGHPTDREIEDWFKQNFGSALFPTESRREWVKDHWAEVGSAEKIPSEASELARAKDAKLREALCPDLAKLFDGSFEGLFATAEAGSCHLKDACDRNEFEALKIKVEKLERLVSRLTMSALETEFRKHGENPPDTADGSH